MYQKMIKNGNLLQPISIDSLLAYGNEYYLQIQLDNCAYKTVNKQMTDYLDKNVFGDQIL